MIRAMSFALVAATAFARQDAFSVDRLLVRAPAGVAATPAIAFAPDGTRVAYVGTKDGKSVPVVGEDIGDAFDFVDPPVFAPSSAQVAFRAGKRVSSKSEKWWILLDGKKTAQNDWIGALSWSPDGKRLAYWTQPGARIGADGAYTGGDLVLVIDGKKGAKWADADALSPPVWSADSKVVASTAMKGGEWHVLLDDKSVAKGVCLKEVTLSANGKRYAFSRLRLPARSASGPGAPPPVMTWEVVGLGGTLGARYESAGTPAISPNGAKVAFKAAQGGKVGLAVDDEPARLEWDFVSGASWSNDGKHLACAVATGCTVDPTWLVTSEGDWSVKGGEWRLLVDGEPRGEPYDELRDLTFSDDGQLLACRARKEGKWRIVCGDRASDAFDLVGPPRFSQDGRLVGFGARLGDELLWRTLAVK
ncbi:MAG: PD40 domain-containing protein [Planctomycetes bacterium]|nr:PD40 domain-containing protein [Planctomycetota bacterium]